MDIASGEMGIEGQDTRLNVALAFAEEVGYFVGSRCYLLLSSGFAVRIEANTLRFGH